MTKQEIEKAASNADCKYNEPLSFEAGFIAGAEWCRENELKIAIEALKLIANDLDKIGVTPTEICHLETARNALDKIARSE